MSCNCRQPLDQIKSEERFVNLCESFVRLPWRCVFSSSFSALGLLCAQHTMNCNWLLLTCLTTRLTTGVRPTRRALAAARTLREESTGTIPLETNVLQRRTTTTGVALTWGPGRGSHPIADLLKKKRMMCTVSGATFWVVTLVLSDHGESCLLMPTWEDRSGFSSHCSPYVPIMIEMRGSKKLSFWSK